MPVCGHALYRASCPICWQARSKSNQVHTPQPPRAEYNPVPAGEPPPASRPPGLRSQPHQYVRLSLGEGNLYNCALAREPGRTFLAYRVGLGGSTIRVALLGDGYEPLNDWELDLRHEACSATREDPRLFRWRGRWWMSFVGGQYDGRTLLANQLIVPLDGNLRAGQPHCPGYTERRYPMEKNWAWFEWADELFCVYTVSPHRVLHFDGDRVHRFSQTDPKLPWTGGHLRGGASPVRVGDVFYHWFHGAWDDRIRVYNAGVYTFEAKPPFRILRMTRDPVLLPRSDDLPYQIYSSIVFPCGAVLSGGRWLVSYGYHDTWSEVAVFDAALIESLLEDVPC